LSTYSNGKRIAVVALVDIFEREEDRVLDELVEGVVQLRDRSIENAGDDVGREASPEHGAGLRKRPGVIGQPAGVGEDRVLERVGNGGPEDRPAVGGRAIADRGEELLDEERDAVGPPEDRVDDLACRRQPRSEEEGRHESGLLAGQPPEADLLGEALVHEAGPPFAVDRAVGQLVEAVSPQHQEWPLASCSSDLGDDLE